MDDSEKQSVSFTKRLKQFEDATKGTFGTIIANASLKSVQFLDVMSALSGLCEEADIVLTPDVLTLRQMDPSHIALVNVELQKGFFRPL